MENSFRKPVVRLMLNVDVVVDADVKLKYNCCLLIVNNDKNLSSFDIICKAHRVAKCDGELLKKVSVKNHGKGLT